MSHDPVLDRPASDGTLSPYTVLLLDDDPTMRSAVAATLRDAGCRNVLHTANGARALSMLTAYRVDLVLCDWEMPGMDGPSFLRAMRARRDAAHIPVIMLTANASPKDAWDMQALKVAGWLVKPVAPQSVAAQVAATLGGLPPRVRENLLEELVLTYEAALPREVARLHQQAQDWAPDAEDFDLRLDALYQRLHQVKGQAGTMGYALLGEIADLLHGALRRATYEPDSARPHRDDLVRLARIGLAGMKLIADRRLRGQGGAVGDRMKAQLTEYAEALDARMSQSRAADIAALAG